jgi:hypothetical protein
MPEVPYLPASTTAPYSAPSHDAMENLVDRFVHQPHMPNLAELLDLELWSEGMTYMMSHKGLSEAPEGCARFDKGLADKGMYRVLRNITRNEKGNYVDPDLEKNAPLQFALLSIIMKNHGFSDIAIQDLVYQEMHCDPYAHSAVLEDAAYCCHVLMSWSGGHNLAVSSSHLIQDLDTRYHSWKSSSGGNRRAAVKVGVGDLDDVLLIPRQGKTPLQAIPQFFLGGNTTGASPETIFPIHAGSPSDTKLV